MPVSLTLVQGVRISPRQTPLQPTIPPQPATSSPGSSRIRPRRTKDKGHQTAPTASPSMGKCQESTYRPLGLGGRTKYSFVLPRTVAELTSCKLHCTTNHSPVLARLAALSLLQGLTWRSSHLLSNTHPSSLSPREAGDREFLHAVVLF